MIRSLYRRLLDHEVGVLGGQLDRNEARLLDCQTELQALQIRMTNLVQRVSMRLNRAGGGDRTDREIIAELQQRRGAQQRGNGDFDDGRW